MQKINDGEHCELLTTIRLDKDFRERCPIAYAEKRRELIENGESEDEVDRIMRTMEIEIEVYYHRDYGFVALESEAVECMDEIFSPYTGKVFAKFESDNY